MVIPNQLQTWRFILLSPKKKIPTVDMKGWAENIEQNTFTYNSPKLLAHIEAGGNYGTIAGPDHIIIATDTKDIEKAIEDRLPPTFTVRSPRHKTKHFYFNGKIGSPIQCKPSASGDPCADIRIGNTYVVGPNSVFENYGKYEVVDDRPIANVAEEELLAAIDDFIEKKDEKTIERFLEATDSELTFPIAKLLELDSMSRRGNEFYGIHPKHGSTTGNNFYVNIEKNVWHCFRSGHDSGGGPLQLLAVMEGIINCEDAKKGALNGANFIATAQKAKEKQLLKNVKVLLGKDDEPIVKPDMEAILEYFETSYVFKTSKDVEEIYVYQPEDGTYCPAEHIVKAKVEGLLPRSLVTTHLVEEILNHIRRGSYIERSEFNKITTSIPVKNGLLNLKNGKLDAFTSDKIFTFKINASYDIDKDCPKFKAFLNEVLPPEDQQLLQEYCGYCLLPAFPYHKIMWLYGTGRNGKGRIILTMTALLDQRNVSNVALEDLDGTHRFSVANLYGSLMNVCSEPTTNKPLRTPLLKKIAGEDWLDGEIKNKQKPIRFQNFSKFFILGNRFARVDDTTPAFWERTLMINFPNAFTEENGKIIPDIQNRWIKDEDEMSGLLNWLIAGLTRLMVSNGFTKSKTMQETIAEFKKTSDIKSAFLDEECLKNPKHIITQEELYNTYKDYSSEMGEPPESKSMFNARIRKEPGIAEGWHGKDRLWRGIDLKPPAEIPQEKEDISTLDATASSTPTTPNYNSFPTNIIISKDIKCKIGVVSEVTAVDVSNRCGDSLLDRLVGYVRTFGFQGVGILLAVDKLGLREETIISLSKSVGSGLMISNGVVTYIGV